MSKRKPANGRSVWVEYPESVHVRATYDAARDAFVLEDGTAIAAAEIGHWGQRKPGAKKEGKTAKQPNIFVRIIAGAMQVILDLF